MRNILTVILIFSSLSLFSQKVLKIKEVFNFDIEDEFQYKINNASPNAITTKVLNKYYSTNNDSLFYVVENNNYSSVLISQPSPHLEYSFSKSTDTIFYTNLDFSVDTYYDFLNYDSLKSSGASFSYDSLYFKNSCDVQINGFDCSVNIEHEADNYHYEFGEGIGITKEYIVDGENPTPRVDKSLIYYKKAATSCGTKDITSSPALQAEETEFDIYPNPFSDQITFKLPDHIGQFNFEVLDLLGKRISVGKIKNNEFIVLNNCKTGIYIVKVYNDQFAKSRIIIKE